MDAKMLVEMEPTTAREYRRLNSKLEFAKAERGRWKERVLFLDSQIEDMEEDGKGLKRLNNQKFHAEGKFEHYDKQCAPLVNEISEIEDRHRKARERFAIELEE